MRLFWKCGEVYLTYHVPGTSCPKMIVCKGGSCFSDRKRCERVIIGKCQRLSWKGILGWMQQSNQYWRKGARLEKIMMARIGDLVKNGSIQPSFPSSKAVSPAHELNVD